MIETILQVQRLCKYFSGLAAVDNVSLEVKSGVLHAVIGPNGAGKTTLINLLSGDLPVSAGMIAFRGREISRLAPEQRSRLGIGRSYQKTNIFPAFTAFENCRLAAQSRTLGALHWWRDARSDDRIMTMAHGALAAVGLAARGDELALALSHGEPLRSE